VLECCAFKDAPAYVPDVWSEPFAPLTLSCERVPNVFPRRLSHGEYIANIASLRERLARTHLRVIKHAALLALCLQPRDSM